MKRGNVNSPAYRGVTDPYAKSNGGQRQPNTNKPATSPAKVQTGLLIGKQGVPAHSPKTMQRATQGVPLGQVGNNPTVTSKAQRNGYGENVGHQPSQPMGSPYQSPPVRHVTPAGPKAATQVGFVDGKFVTPTYK